MLDTEHGIAPPAFEQDEYEKAGPLIELPHFEGNIISSVPVLSKGTLALGVTVKV